METSIHLPVSHQPAASDAKYHRAPLLHPRPQEKPNARRRPIRALVLALVLGLAAQIIVFAAAAIIAALMGAEVETTVLSDDPNNVTSNTILLLSLAAIVVVPFFAARIARYQSRFIFSVVGRIRWGIVGVAAAVSLAISGAGQVIAFATGGGAEPRTLESQDFIFLAVVLVLVPFQAAGEEVFARGFLPQIFGHWFKSPWIAYLPGALLWIALHGYNTWGTVTIAYSAILYAILVHKTGGLEAVIAIHTINNYFAFAQQVFIVIEDPETIPWEAAVFDMVSTTITVGVVYLCVRRLASVSTPHHASNASSSMKTKRP